MSKITELELETRKLIAAHDFVVDADDTLGKRLNFWVGRCEVLLNLLAAALPSHVAVISPPEAQEILANPKATKEEIERAHGMTYEVPCEHSDSTAKVGKS